VFFPERITSIRPSDRVLEVGPGGTPHPRADVFLERAFDDPTVALGQRGYAPPLKTGKPVMRFDGRRFPFEDGAFDYVICSHVLEHVEDVDSFAGELTRVAPRGYVEFPTIYYDYAYNFPEHITLVAWRDGVVRWMPKAESGLARFAPVTRFFYEAFKRGHGDIVRDLLPFFFQGFEWSGGLMTRRTTEIADLTPAVDANDILAKPSPVASQVSRAVSFWRRIIRRLGGMRP
jgi:hypothetical protein